MAQERDLAGVRIFRGRSVLPKFRAQEEKNVFQRKGVRLLMYILQGLVLIYIFLDNLTFKLLAALLSFFAVKVNTSVF